MSVIPANAKAMIERADALPPTLREGVPSPHPDPACPILAAGLGAHMMDKWGNAVAPRPSPQFFAR
jgi:hypothetical protein